VVSLRTALRAYEQAERWEDVLRTLRLVEKRDALHPVATAQLRARALAALLARSVDDPAAVRALWKGLRADERASGAVALQFARAFAGCGLQDEARRIAEQALDAGMDDELVGVFGRLDSIPVRDRLDRLEGWRTRHGDAPGVLTALGEVCASEKLWGKAEDYLQQALRREPSVRAHLALGELYERLGPSAEAGAQYRDAAKRAV
jgi:HemY protein